LHQIATMQFKTLKTVKKNELYMQMKRLLKLNPLTSTKDFIKDFSSPNDRRISSTESDEGGAARTSSHIKLAAVSTIL
jgi:hypothetical protein